MPLVDELPVTIQSAYFAADYLASRSPGAHVKAIIDDFLEYHHLADKRRDPSFGEALEEFGTLGFAWERAVMQSLSPYATNSQLWKDLDEVGEPPAPTLRAIYEHAFSRSLNEAWAERSEGAIVKLGETEVDGIFCTQDGYNKRLRTPEEWKCTWSSANAGIKEDWSMQMAAYAHAWGFDRYILRAMYVNGYYEKGQMGRPVARAWRVRWSDHELIENWALITEHRDLMVEEGRL